MAKKARPIGASPTLGVTEAQDAIAACLSEIETLAWKFFRISRDLDVDLRDEEFPEEKPGPDHLRFATALGCMGTYYELLEVLESARRDAVRDHQDLVYDWEKRSSPGAAPPPARQASGGGTAAKGRKPAIQVH